VATVSAWVVRRPGDDGRGRGRGGSEQQQWHVTWKPGVAETRARGEKNRD
jgi:hypothetical protein